MTFEQFQEAITIYQQLLTNQRVLDAVMGRPTMFISNSIYLDDIGKEEAIVVLGAQQERLVQRLRNLDIEIDLNKLLKERESSRDPS